MTQQNYSTSLSLSSIVIQCTKHENHIWKIIKFSQMIFHSYFVYFHRKPDFSFTLCFFGFPVCVFDACVDIYMNDDDWKKDIFKQLNMLCHRHIIPVLFSNLIQINEPT